MSNSVQKQGQVPNPHKWPSTENLGSILRDIINGKIKCMDIGSFFDSNVIITEKMDGSNVSVGIDTNTRQLLPFYSRKTELKDSSLNGVDISFLENYLEHILAVYDAYMSEHGENISKFFVVGEIHFGDDNKKAVAYNKYNYGPPAWFPFGIITVTEGGHKESHFLTDDIVRMFVEHGFNCPKIIFRGKLSDGIKEIHDTMMGTNLEGVFITPTTCDSEGFRTGFKYKIGIREERPTAFIAYSKKVSEWSDVERKCIWPNEDIINVMGLIDEVFLNKKVVSCKKNSKKKIQTDPIADSMIKLAGSKLVLNSELSKRDIDIKVFRNLDRDGKKQFMNDIAEAMVNDCMEEQPTYAENEGVKKKMMASATRVVGYHMGKLLKDNQ